MQAAIFDLDRTILSGGSGPVITASLAAQGLVPAWQAGVANATFGIYDRMGESRLSMELARRVVGRAKGWDALRVRKAAEMAADELSARLLPRASALIEDHRREGRPVVLATTTAEPLVEPFAERLGVDGVVATQWERDGDDNFTGRLAGPFIWGREKKNAVASWCVRNGAALEESYAYSDSIYDLPLLDAAGHPHAVNPDARLRTLATFRRWPVLDLTVLEGVPHLGGTELLDAAPLLRPRCSRSLGGASKASSTFPSAGL